MAKKKAQKARTIKKGKSKAVVAMNKARAAKTKKNKAAFLVNYVKSSGIVTKTAKATGVSARQFYEWVEMDEQFRLDVLKADKVVIGHYKDKLLECADDKNITAIIFYLKNKSPEFKEKVYHGLDEESFAKTYKLIKDMYEKGRERRRANPKLIQDK